jgi:hypothetical protein
MSKYRIALGFLIVWTVIIVTVGVEAIVSGVDSRTVSPNEWTEDDVRNLTIVAGAFATWTIGLVTITCITIIVRLGHLRSSNATEGTA